MKTTAFLLILLCLLQSVVAQKDIKITYDSIKNQCKDLPNENRVRITVARFTNTTGGVTGSNAPATVASIIPGWAIPGGANNPSQNFDVGGNLTTMLTDALQSVNCYTVLESLKNKQDMDNEIDESSSVYSDKKSAPKKGKQLGAQVVVTGEIIEYSLKNTGINIAGVGVHKKIAKIGFNIKMVNPETRQVLFSKIIHEEAKTGDDVSVLGIVSTGNDDPAVEAALEKGVVQAVQFIVAQKDFIQLPSGNIGSPGVQGTNQTEVTLNNANFNSFTAFAALLNNISTLKSIVKTLSSGVAVYTIVHTGTSDALLDEINKKVSNKYEVTGFGDGKIELKVK